MHAHICTDASTPGTPDALVPRIVASAKCSTSALRLWRSILSGGAAYTDVRNLRTGIVYVHTRNLWHMAQASCMHVCTPVDVRHVLAMQAYMRTHPELKQSMHRGCFCGAGLQTRVRSCVPRI